MSHFDLAGHGESFWRNTVEAVIKIRTGINPEEYLAPQSVKIAATVWIPLLAIEDVTKIEGVVNYHAIYCAINRFSEGGHYDLLEAVAVELIQACFEADDRIGHAMVTIQKLEIYGPTASPSVSLSLPRHFVTRLPSINGAGA